MLLALLFPAYCIGCGREQVSAAVCQTCAGAMTLLAHNQCPRCNARLLDGKVCEPCRSHLGFGKFFAALQYQNPLVRAAIDALKFDGVRRAAKPLTQSLINMLSRHTLPKNLVVLPMPLHPTRRAQRGFNQSEILGETLARELSLNFISDREKVLVRTRPTQQQSRLTKEKRLENVSGAFGVPKPELVLGKTLLVVDDVLTTGATMSEASRALTRAGAKTVWAVAAAQG